MMYSVEKCAGRSETGAADECEMYAGGGEAMGPEGVASDEVSSAVVAASNDIEEMLFREQLGDARVDGLGVDLTDLSAELGLLAGLADGEAPPDFTSRFEVPFEWIGLSERAESESSSSWSGGRSARRPPRPPRVARRRPPIVKGKDMRSVRAAALRRAASVRARRADLVSDASDVGADSDSDDQWTELDDNGQSGTSDNSSEKEAAAGDCNGYQHRAEPEPPGMGQLLLPLLSAEPTADPEHLVIRHEDILQLLASAEDIPLHGGDLLTADVGSSDEAAAIEGEDDPITPEDEAALLRYVCASRTEQQTPAAGSDGCEPQECFEHLEEWLQGVYHSWCEISALMYTLIGTNMSEELIDEEWVYRARFGCHCRLCLSLALGARPVGCLLRRVVTAMAHGEGTSQEACALVRALQLSDGDPNYDLWDIRRLKRIAFTDRGAEIIHAELSRLAMQNDTAREIVCTVCLCKPAHTALDTQNAVERFCNILENFKAASNINFKVAMIPPCEDSNSNSADGPAAGRVSRALAPHQRCSTAARIRSMRGRTEPANLLAWQGYKHRCDCLTPRSLSAQQRKQLLRISFFGMLQAVTDFHGGGAACAPPGHGHGGPDTRPEVLGRPDIAANDNQATVQHHTGKTVEATNQAHMTAVTDATGQSLEACFQQLDVNDKNQDLASKDQDQVEDQSNIVEAECAKRAPDDARGNDGAVSDEWSRTGCGMETGTETEGSLGLSSSSLDSASELLLAAAAAVGDGSDGSDAAQPPELCRTVRHLMRSIASIERLMDRVLKHCDQWLVVEPSATADHEARKRVDVGLSEVDRKLMAMYRRLPEVHRRQLQVYRKQKKLSTVCTQLVGGEAPLPPPPGSPPAPPEPPRLTHPHGLCPDYHLMRFREVRRKVMHMRDQQLYYHRLRTWLEGQLGRGRQRRDSDSDGDGERDTGRDSVPKSTVTKVEDLPRRKRRTASPKPPRQDIGSKRALKPAPVSKPHKILQLLRHKAPANTTKLLAEIKDETAAEVEPPQAFPIAVAKEDGNDVSELSEADTIVGEKGEEPDLCNDMKECLAKFASFALNDERDKEGAEVKYPESVSPPLQELSPTTETEPMPVYTPQPSQRLLAVNKLLNRNEDPKPQLLMPEVLNISVPLNARRTPVLVKEENPKEIIQKIEENVLIVDKLQEKDPNIYKYVTFGIEIKKAMEECQNIINSYNSIHEKEKDEGHLSLEQICEVMMSLDKNSAEFLDKIDSAEATDGANTKLAELVENMPQILANMPEIASKLSEFANASCELPEFASIMNSLPDVSNEAQLTPETLKQIRELKLSKNRDSIKVTKNTAKRKSSRRPKNTVDEDGFIDLDSREICELLKDDKDIQVLMKCKANNKENFKDLLFSLSAQVVINKVFEYLKQNRSPEGSKCLEEEKDLLSLPIDDANAEMYSKASTLFDNSVKDALSMKELRDLVRSRFNSWKNYVAAKFKSIPMELLENEIEAMLEKFYNYIQDLSSKFNNDKDKIAEKIEELRKESEEKESDGEYCPTKDSLRQITKLLSSSEGNTFDLLIMKVSKLSQDKKHSVKGLKFKYMDVIKRCSDSPQLAGWIILNPEIAANVIQELTGLPIQKTENINDFTAMSNDGKIDYFIERLSAMNRQYLNGIPKNAITGDEWLVLLYRIEQLQVQLKEALIKANTTPKSQNKASEAEILAARGLSKIIAKANYIAKMGKKSEPPKKVDDKPKETKTEVKDEKEEKKAKNELLLAKCEAILLSKGDKALLENFYAIKSYIAQGLPVPESYKKHVVAICSSIDAKLLDEGLDDIDLDIDTFKSTLKDMPDDKNLSVIGSQNPELLAKYSAQALRNAQQTLNSVTFRNIFKNGQSKSESEACDTPKSECKWTNDCVCNQCKDCNDKTVGDVKQSDVEGKCKTGMDDKKMKEQANKQAKPQAKAVLKAQGKCENQHVCKVGHTPPGGGSCAGDASSDQPCSCCYCTVFGHAPPLTTPVPRNFNETRERLRSILNKKKQKCRPNGSAEPAERRPVAQLQPLQCSAGAAATAATATATAAATGGTGQPQPPALPKSLPPRLPSPRRADPRETRVIETVDGPKAMPVPPTPLRTEGKVNATAMEQIRIQQQRKLQQQAQLQSQMQQQQLQQQHAQLLQQKYEREQQHLNKLQQQEQNQQKPEPIYDLPIHNKPTLTSEQQQQIRLRQQQLQQHHLQQQQLQQQLKHTQMQQQHLQQQKQLQQIQVQQQEQQLLQQRGSRPPLQQDMSLSSRDSSVFSTSSGCDGSPCWRGGRSRAEDPRDLDALLQYIEGPARLRDRGKKRAKKQRQKAKKLEQRLEEEKASLSATLEHLKRESQAIRATHASTKRRVEELKKVMATQQKTNKKKGKKSKGNGAQQAKCQEMAEQLAELTSLLSAAAKEVQETDKQLSDLTRDLQRCEKELVEAKSVLGKTEEPSAAEQALEEQAFLHQQKLQHQQLLQRKQQLLAQQRQLQARAEEARTDRLKQTAILNATSASSVVRVRRSGDGVTVTCGPGPAGEATNATLAQLLQAQKGAMESRPEQKPSASAADRKHTWEQALAHINQLAKGQAKEKKKQKESKPEPKPKEARSQSLPDASQALSKKQRKALAKQQAEEEEKRRQEELAKQEAKAKKEAKKADAKSEKKSDKKADLKKLEPAKKNQKEDKRETNKDRVQEKKGKENKQEKSAPPPKAKQPVQSQPQPSKKEKKKDQSHSQPHPSHAPAEQRKPSDGGAAACSIMEQLSCGVHVADLRLPPGITLTRVQPSEKKQPPVIKSVPLWKSSQLPVPPTPVARPVPVINADPSMMAFSTAHPEPPKPIIIPEPQPQTQAPKSKKAKKKAKKAASEEPKSDGTKMVTLRNPMFHPNLPQVQVTNNPQQQQKKAEIRIPDPIPMPPNACQATITPTSNGMYTIRNPLMSMMHQQTMMGVPQQQMNPVYTQPQYNYVNPNVYIPQTQQAYVIDTNTKSNTNSNTNSNITVNVTSQKNDEIQSRIMNLASFTQKNDEGYSLFSSSEDQQQRNFLAPEYYENPSPKPTVSPNPIGTRPNENRPYECDTSLFANPIQRPEPIGTPLKREDDRGDYSSLYTPFGQEDRNVFRSALFNSSDCPDARGEDQSGGGNDPMPYFQRLRAGAQLSSEVSIHPLGRPQRYQEQSASPAADGSLFSCGAWPEQVHNGAAHGYHVAATGAAHMAHGAATAALGAATGAACDHQERASPPDDDSGYGPVGARHHRPNESSVFVPDRTITNLSSLEVSEREIESFKRFDFYFDPPRNKPKVQLDVRDIAAALKHNQK